MKKILISIKPYYMNLILEGKKKIELRRRIGNEFKRDSDIYLYSSNPVKSIVGEAQIDKIESLILNEIHSETLINLCNTCCISVNNFDLYFKNSNICYLIHLKNIIKYDNPIPLEIMRGLNIRPPQSYCYIDANKSCTLKQELEKI